ncbi:MAG TPA: DUF4386 domain-containing protein [Candidatus Limnocylindrales bacterium]|nr:DUF4386 domain-containing protein [Candidatus Limnocylindrales bacterium]
MREVAPGRLARMAGGLYLINIVLGFFAVGIVPGTIIVAGDPTATIHNLQTHELLYRLGLVAHVIILATNVPLAVIFYELFKVVSRRLAMLVVFFTLVGTAVEGSTLANQFAPLTLLAQGPYAKALPTAQLLALAYLPLDQLGVSYALSSVFFGFYGLTIGYLVYRSTFLPRVIGILLAIGASCYLVYSSAIFISPDFTAHLVPYIQLPSLVGEGSFTLWLLIAGVNVKRWTDRRAPAEVYA